MFKTLDDALNLKVGTTKKGIIGGLLGLFVGLPLLFSSWYTVDEGEAGIEF